MHCVEPARSATRGALARKWILMPLPWHAGNLKRKLQRAPRWTPPSSNRKWRLLRKSQAPRRWRDRIGVRVVPHSAGPNNSLRKRDNLEDRSPPRMASSNVNLGGASLRWTHPQPSKVATLSQIATTPDKASSNLNPLSTSLRRTPQQLLKVTTYLQIAPPRVGEV